MATIDFKLGLIRDRAKDVGLISYYVPNDSKPFMQDCLKGHEHITELIGYGLDKAVLRAHVLRYATLPPSDRPLLIKGLILGLYANAGQPQVAEPAPAPAPEPVKQESVASLADIAHKWLDRKISEGIGERTRVGLAWQIDCFLKFCKEKGICTADALTEDHAYDYIKWRNANNLYSRPVSASLVNHEIQTIRNVVKLAAKMGCIGDSRVFDDVKVKTVAGVNKKVVEPLSIEAQLELLNKLKANPKHHDVALLLLVTGMRVGELDTLTPNSIQNSLLTLHNAGVGNMKTTGKTARANRTIPACPVLAKLFARGHIFKIKANAFKTKLNHYFKGNHAHRLRHTFAVNNLLAKRDLQMVSYQIGHADIGLTANLYGKFEPAHFKAGFEQTIKARQAHLQWLEQDYEF